MRFGKNPLLADLIEAIYPLPNLLGGYDQMLRLYCYDVAGLPLATLQRELDRLSVRLIFDADVPDPWLIERRDALEEALTCHQRGIPVPRREMSASAAEAFADVCATEAYYAARMIAARGEGGEGRRGREAGGDLLLGVPGHHAASAPAPIRSPPARTAPARTTRTTRTTHSSTAPGRASSSSRKGTRP